MAFRKRVDMRVAAEISSRVTPRISRSRFRLSPKVSLVIFLQRPVDLSEYRRAARGCQSHGKPGGLVYFGTLFTFEQQSTKSPLHRRIRVDYNFWCPNTFRGPA